MVTGDDAFNIGLFASATRRIILASVAADLAFPTVQAGGLSTMRCFVGIQRSGTIHCLLRELVHAALYFSGISFSLSRRSWLDLGNIPSHQKLFSVADG